MNLADFSSLFELSAGMNFAFVAVEYASSFSNIFIKNFCTLTESIKQRSIDIEKIVDKDTLNSFEEIKAGNRSDLCLIENAKRSCEVAAQSLKAANVYAVQIIAENSKAKCFSFFSLYLGLYSLLALFLSGFGETGYRTFSLDVLLIFTVLSLFYLVLGLGFQRFKILPDKVENLFFCFSSLSLSIVYFVVGIFISCVIAYFCESEVVTWLEWTPPIFAMSTFMNFVIYTILLKWRAHHAAHLIKVRFDSVKEEYDNLNKEIQRISIGRNYISEMSQQS